MKELIIILSEGTIPPEGIFAIVLALSFVIILIITIILYRLWNNKGKEIVRPLTPLFRMLNKTFSEDELNKIERKKYYQIMKKKENGK